MTFYFILMRKAHKSNAIKQSSCLATTKALDNLIRNYMEDKREMWDREKVQKQILSP